MDNPFKTNTDFMYTAPSHGGALDLYAYEDGSISVEIDRAPDERAIIFIDGAIAQQLAEWILSKRKAEIHEQPTSG